MSAEILPFPVQEKDTFEDGWSSRAGQMKKRGDGREKTKALWRKHAKKVGSARLLEALKRYLREEKEPTCGYPGLSVWLNGERYDHWMTTGETTLDPSRASACLAAEPFRSKLILALGEPFVRSYLDPCTFHEDGYITPRTTTAQEKLMEKRRELKAAGIAGIRKRE